MKLFLIALISVGFCREVSFAQNAEVNAPSSRLELLRTNLVVISSENTTNYIAAIKRTKALMQVGLCTMASEEAGKFTPQDSAARELHFALLKKISDSNKRVSDFAFRTQIECNPGFLSGESSQWAAKLNEKLNRMNLHFADSTVDNIDQFVTQNKLRKKQTAVLVMHPSLLIKQRNEIGLKENETHRLDFQTLWALAYIGVSLTRDLETVICLDKSQNEGQIGVLFYENKGDKLEQKKYTGAFTDSISRDFKTATDPGKWVGGGQEMATERIALSLLREYVNLN